MSSSTPPQSSLRSRLLPQVPLPTAPLFETSDEPGTSMYTRSRPQARSNRDRNSILTIGSVASTLPRYSRIDLPGLGDSVEPVEHWDSENDLNTTVLTNPGADPSSPSYPTFEDVDPPTYTELSSSPQRPNFVVHKFHMTGGLAKVVTLGRSSKRGPWATMKLLTRRPLPGSTRRLPRFIGGDALQGSVDLQLDTPMNVHSIKLTLKAKAQVSQALRSYPVVSYHTFLNKSYTIYSKTTSGDPRENGQCDVSKSREPNGTLRGSYSFPFDIPFPTRIDRGYSTQEEALQSVQAGSEITYEAPPSFRENSTISAAVYELGFEITHGPGPFKAHNRTTTEIVYTPKKVSPPASEKRQAAYREATLLPGPSFDPDGWHALPALIIQGKYQSRSVEATCVLYLANPVSFTRGTTIPCFLSFSCLDSGFLEALASPRSINARLVREIRHLAQSPAKGGESTGGQTSTKIYIAKAVWWKPQKSDTPSGLDERYLEGEVHLPKSLVSSCDFPLFTIEYMVELLPFTIFSFTSAHEVPRNDVNKPTDSKDVSIEPLIQQVVDVTNFHESGPVPVAFTTRVTDDERRNEGPSWANSSDGLGLMGTSFMFQGLGIGEVPTL